MDVLPCQVRECRTEILVSEEDPDSALSDLNDHLKTHGLDDEDTFHYWMASQLAAREGSATIPQRHYLEG